MHFFLFFPAPFNLIRHLRSLINFMHTHFIQRVWTCPPQLFPSQNCICVSCSTEHAKLQVHLAEKFCSLLGRDLGGGVCVCVCVQNFPSDGEKQYKTFIISGLDIAGPNGNNIIQLIPCKGTIQKQTNKKICIYFYQGSLCQASFGEIQISPALASCCC